MIYNRTDAATATLAEIDAWCLRTNTPETHLGHVLFFHPGFVALLRKRLTITEEKEEQVRAFLAEHPDGWRGELPKTHANGVKRRVSRPRNAKLDSAIRRWLDPQSARIDRDPCPRCGVRGDLECGHSRARLGTVL